MNVPTITMDPEQALEAYHEYRQAVKDNPNAQDKAVMMGYRAMAKGRAVLNVVDALRAGGIDAKGLPKLAMAWADWEWAWLYAGGLRGDVCFSQERWIRGRPGRRRIDFADGTLPGLKHTSYDVRAMVPSIPPRLRPESGQLGNYHILWEAVWENAPPTDPMLLRCIKGPLYVVLATWDLTPLERAVLGAARQGS